MCRKRRRRGVRALEDHRLKVDYTTALRQWLVGEPKTAAEVNSEPYSHGLDFARRLLPLRPAMSLIDRTGLFEVLRDVTIVTDRKRELGRDEKLIKIEFHSVCTVLDEAAIKRRRASPAAWRRCVECGYADSDGGGLVIEAYRMSDYGTSLELTARPSRDDDAHVSWPLRVLSTDPDRDPDTDSFNSWVGMAKRLKLMIRQPPASGNDNSVPAITRGAALVCQPAFTPFHWVAVCLLVHVCAPAANGASTHAEPILVDRLLQEATTTNRT